MIKIELFYNSDVDRVTPVKAEELRTKYGEKIDLYLVDVSRETSPAEYGTINPPELILDGSQRFKLSAPESLGSIVMKAIF